MLPKLLMKGIKLERVAPTQEQVAHQQDIPSKWNIDVNFVKCCGSINWLYFSRFWPFFRFIILKTLPKIDFKASDNSYKPLKSHWLGNVSRSMCRKWNMDVKFVKKMSLAYAGYISKIFTLFPLIAYKLLSNTTKTPNKLQNTQVYTTKPTGLSWNQK